MASYWASVLAIFDPPRRVRQLATSYRSAAISGTVVRVDADDKNFVNAGQVLVQLDRADAKVASSEGRRTGSRRPL
jgi:multidrug efflux pump subunit AcrA (membrane-fusion protein)